MNQSRDNVQPLHTSDPNQPFDIPAEQLERIIARASVLQNALGEGEQRRLSEEEIISIGQEVGLNAEHVRRALAEYRADSLVPPEPEEHPLLTKLLGPGHARARRVIPGDPVDLHRQFEHQMVAREKMRAVRLRSTESVWEADKSWTGKLGRALDFNSDGHQVAELESISIVTAPASSTEAMVTLTADVREERKEQSIGWGVGLVMIAIFVLVPYFTKTPWLWLLLGPVLAVATFGAVYAMRSAIEAKRQRVALLLEGLLDKLEYRR
ncbi:MAG: hypothetical protein AAGJ52_11365 [Pseudomonadota bacterium]